MLALVTTLTLLPGDALAQAKHYPLESTTALRLVNAVAEPAPWQEGLARHPVYRGAAADVATAAG